MKLTCLSFSRKGRAIAKKIKQEFRGEVRRLTCLDYKDNLESAFRESEGIVFISSTGIAVRLAAPFLSSKQDDPAVVVIDDMGKYVISLISGHLGGANELARTLAGIIQAQPVITTASEGRGIEAVDLFAKRTGLIIEDMEAAKQVTALMVDGRRIAFYSEFEETINYPNLVSNHPEGCIFVDVADKIDCAVPSCILRPGILNIGIGCRKGTSAEEIIDAIRYVFMIHNLSLKSIASIATIELKKEEPGIVEASRFFDCELRIFSTEEIAQIEHQFESSTFVKEQTGVGAVCEPCAYLAGGDLIVSKIVRDGITLAVSKSKNPI